MQCWITARTGHTEIVARSTDPDGRCVVALGDAVEEKGDALLFARDQTGAFQLFLVEKATTK